MTARLRMTKPTWLFNFLIGFTAGLCASLFPRLVAALTVYQSSIGLLTGKYVMLSMAFAAIIGLVTVILSSGGAKSPADTFMMALGIPALLTGALNTAGTTGQFAQNMQDNARNIKELSERAGISTLSPSPLLLLDQPHAAASSPHPLALGLIGPRSAQAQPLGPPAQQHPSTFGFGVQINEPHFVVVLDRAATQEEAVQKAAQLSARVPGAQAAKTDEGYVVIQGGPARTQSDAALEALRIKKEHGLNPALMEVK